jgi:tripartite-type tricarboxylate transporter receptor subunit TctC
MLSRLMRAAMAALATVAAGALTPHVAEAQSASPSAYPSQGIRFIVPYAAGGLPDTVARIVAQRLSDRLKQSVVVENRPGAAGSVAANALVSAPADGYTFIVTDGSMMTTNALLIKQLGYNPKDLTPVALLARAPLFLAIHPKVPVSTLREFVAHVKAHPGQINYGSSGVGSPHHLSMEAIKSELGLQMTHVPYRGTGQSVPALLGGHVETLFSAYPSLVGAVENKSIKLIATNGAKRSPQAPDVPPLADLIHGFDLSTMIGILARAGTPKPIIDKIAAESMVVVQQPEAGKQFAAAGIEPAGAGPADFGKFLASEAEHVAKVVKAAGITPQ